MDRTDLSVLPALDNGRDDVFMAEKQRFNSFSFGKSQPTSVPSPLNKPSHGRSHSRNNSFTSQSSVNTLSTANDVPSVNPLIARHSKRLSHHRRQSSVSTRVESAEIMGVAVPSLPTSLSDSDNVSLGNKDSIRRRALLALEGKSEVGAFSHVEIPEFDTDKRVADTVIKPSFPAVNGLNFGIAGLAGKRDSFGKPFRSSTSLKECLHTLVEEEEDDEAEEEQDSAEPVEHLASIPSGIVARVSTGINRQRPSSLCLRPLTLAGGLPTPTLSPGSRSSETTPSPYRPNLNISTGSPSPLSSAELKPRRLSSISYKTSPDSARLAGNMLPTPDMTPTSDRRHSLSSSDNSDRPAQTIEQQFLHKSHNALLSRIEDLERALKKRDSQPFLPSTTTSARSRPVSVSSDASFRTDASDEMVQLVTDLKSERDEIRLQLEQDAAGWRLRVDGLEKQVNTLAKRIEVERRDAWVARERAGLLEVEKKALSKVVESATAALESMTAKYEAAEEELEELRLECEALRPEKQARIKLEAECATLKASLEAERSQRQEYERELELAGMLTTPTPQTFEFPARGTARGLGFRSIDSANTDVDSFEGAAQHIEQKLRVVAEEDDDYQDNSLQHYEDEDEELDCNDTYSSNGSFDEAPRDARALLETPASSSRSTTPSPLNTPVTPQHVSRASLSKTWTFPMGQKAAVAKRVEEVDDFFGYLQDDDVSPITNAFTAAADGEKISFGSGIDLDDEFPPFIIPADVGVPVVEEPRPLDILVEEDEEEEEAEEEDDEDDFGGELVAGGIKFTFTAPSAPNTPEPTLVLSNIRPDAFSEPLMEETEPFSFPTANWEAESDMTAPATPPRASKIARTALTKTATTPSRSAVMTSSFIPQPKGGKYSTPPKAPAAFVAQPRKVSAPMPSSPSPPRTVFSPQTKASTSTMIPVRRASTGLRF